MLLANRDWITLSRMPKLSVLICCANAADTLAAACRSVHWADELVVVDSGSTDATSEIAKSYAIRYVEEPWRGYAGQKVFGADLCAHDWVFILDGDEECSSELADEWRAMTDDAIERYDVFLVPRRNYIFGRHVRAWDPDHQARIVHRRRCRWTDEVVHDTCYPSSPERQTRLRGHITHKRTSTAAFSDYFGGRRLDARLLLLAQQMYQRGRRCHWWDLAFRPRLAFLKLYLLKGGFLDGTFGLLMAQKTALTTQLKYAALWAVQNDVANHKDDTQDET